jgi:D-glucosaminate-specific PTS system IID component
MSEINITKKDIRKSYNRWWWTAEMASSFDRQQAVGFCFAMSSILKKLYGDNKEQFSAALKRHMIFFNTMATWGGAILGLSISLEKEKAEGGNVPDDAIISLKTGLMGPLAGIGDSINLATFRVLFFSLAASIGATGNPIAAFIPLVYTVADWYFGLYMTNLGYQVGKKSITTMLESGLIDKIIKAAGILGLFMVGALTAKNVSLSLAPVFVKAGVKTSVQSIVDNICPGLLQLMAVLGCYVYFKKCSQNFGKLVLLILVICLVLSFIGLV